MPDREVQTIRHLIYYQYAKIVARSALGEDAKKQSYGFIKTTFREFVKSEKKWSDILREDKQLIKSDGHCIYCGSEEATTWDHILPKSFSIKTECETCDRLQGIHNQIPACKICNSQKGTKGLYHFYRDRLPGVKKFYDQIPPLLEKKYLKTIYYCHTCNGTLDAGDMDGDDELSVLDLDFFGK